MDVGWIIVECYLAILCAYVEPGSKRGSGDRSSVLWDVCGLYRKILRYIRIIAACRRPVIAQCPIT